MRGTGVLLRATTVAVAAALAVGLAPDGVAVAQPRDPGDAAISAAQRERARKATEVGRLTGLVARADGDMRRAQDRAELAVEKYNKAVVDLGRATSRAKAARARADAAAKAVAEARKDFSAFARGSYKQGSTLGSTTIALLQAGSPTDLLGRADLLSYAGRRKLDAVGRLERAGVRRANAESAARRAVEDQRVATDQAQKLKAAAAREVSEARGTLLTLQARRSGLVNQLEQARIRLNGLIGERRRYQAWTRQLDIIAAREAARQKRLRQEAAARAAAAARAEAAASRGSGGSRPVRHWTGGTGWSAAKGQRVADLAMRWVGTSYAWGGGNAYGPTRGVDGPGAGWNDGSKFGFDCSGLALWAWAQVGVSLPHYSGYQYQSGQHVSRGDLMPGDLVFWAYDPGDPGSIHHVAIYIGGGQVVQAPQSNDVVRVSSMWYDGYIGATRPGT